MKSFKRFLNEENEIMVVKKNGEVVAMDPYSSNNLMRDYGDEPDWRDQLTFITTLGSKISAYVSFAWIADQTPTSRDNVTMSMQLLQHSTIGHAYDISKFLKDSQLLQKKGLDAFTIMGLVKYFAHLGQQYDLSKIRIDGNTLLLPEAK